MVLTNLLDYIQITILSYFVNLVPIFAPSTWIVLSLFKINNPHISTITIAVFGVIGSVSGRYTMYLYSKVLGKYIPKKYKTSTKFFRKLVEEHKLGLLIGTFIYTLTPLPTNFLFIASGISNIKIRPILSGFAVGRLLSYVLLVSISYKLFSLTKFFNTDTTRFLADLIGIFLTLIVIFIDWKKLYFKTRK